MLDSAFKNLQGKSSAAITPAEAVRLDLLKILDKAVTTLAPKAKVATSKMSDLQRLAPGLEKSAEKDLMLSPLGVPTGISLNQPLQWLQSKGAGVIGGAGGVRSEEHTP